jgi:hypothetical protein
MKYIISLLLSLFAYTVYAGTPITYFYDITPAITIYLTDSPCLMFAPTDDIKLFEAYAKDTLTKTSVQGCWERTKDGKANIKLLNPEEKKFYDFQLPEGLFKPEANI